MKIALLGYGKMGKTIERLAVERGHEIVLKISDDIEKADLQKADVAIDFSVPDAAFKNITTCFEKQVPVVSGTTGWLKQYDKAVEICNENEAAFIYASNFSLGVNLFFELNRNLAKLMSKFPEYKVAIEEIHHTQKLDAPSGTAITLAEQIMENSEKTGWQLDKAADNEIPVTAKRIENVPGTHTISYNSEVDTIKIEHIAHSRDGFALGAIIAAEWLQNKKGVYSMKDVLFNVTD
ncbi:4-hydroxy-tetrahydrodipicolinate reductase [Salinimicrobium sediminilitoris]|uniref:4-hydroxy-tetrahydrodipicolinate reductase n=1 Tax=Salinimicrobium sediminilitoris TaxID=2876715 RepID=UPI001E5F3D4B|nr:4-hydroxy-tetrahydrodipicolinate reductase [Salinimicrobium sediminilitoris]MCC8361401.1 4-hydroxy-tetrahydrodipicolinate reductase [Salinimicrobium sediminilitoris]